MNLATGGCLGQAGPIRERSFHQAGIVEAGEAGSVDSNSVATSRAMGGANDSGSSGLRADSSCERNAVSGR